MSRLDYTVNVDEYLALNKYEVDEESAHIELAEDQDPAEFDKLIMVCPAALYKRDEDGNVSFDYAGCLEGGTCRRPSPLPHHLRRHHHQEVGEPGPDHGRGVPVRLRADGDAAEGAMDRKIRDQTNIPLFRYGLWPGG